MQQLLQLEFIGVDWIMVHVNEAVLWSQKVYSNNTIQPSLIICQELIEDFCIY